MRKSALDPRRVRKGVLGPWRVHKGADNAGRVCRPVGAADAVVQRGEGRAYTSWKMKKSR